MIKRWQQLGEINLLVLTTAFLGFGMVLFGLLAVVAFTSARQARTTLTAAEKKSFQQGQDKQAQDDADASKKQSETPYRSYVAPNLYGSFTIRFPKAWSDSVFEDTGNLQQIVFAAQPDILRTQNSKDDPRAVKVILTREVFATLSKRYQDKVKSKKLTSSNTSVAGIAATRFTGKIDEQGHEGTLVMVPVRDKTILFINEDKTYQPEFEQVLAQSSIVP